MNLDEAIRDAKPEYIHHDIDHVTKGILGILEREQETVMNKKPWRRWPLFAIAPIAIIGGVGFLTHTNHPEGWGTVMLPPQNISPAQKQAELLASAKSLQIGITFYGGFVHAKKVQAFSSNEIIDNFAKVNASTKEIIIQGKIPFIRQDVISSNNIEDPNNSVIKSQIGKFIQARHAINLPSNEISHSFDAITDQTKEILAPNTPPFIRLDVIPPDNRAAVDQ